MAKRQTNQIFCCIKNKHRCMQTKKETECVKMGGYPVNSCSKCK
jgi:hypothetical protein